MLLRTLANILFPPLCLSCGGQVRNDGAVCSNCFEKIAINQTLFCGKCGARLPGEKKICHQDFPYLLGAAADYGNPVLKSLVHGLKFKYVKAAARPLGEILIRYGGTLNLPLEKFSAVPVPLSEKRLRERGFNQSELIAKIFTEHFKLPLLIRALTRSKHAKPQSETKNLSERRGNVRGCFVVKNTTNTSGKNILLIDDVTTSGATLLEAAKALKGAGARKIVALVAARA